MSFELLLWKLKKWFNDFWESLSHSKTRYTVKHTNKGSRIYVCVYDHKDGSYVEQRYSTYYGDYHPSWWKDTMNKASYIYVNPPNDAEAKAGFTYEDKISMAYDIIQVIADGLNNAIREQEERMRKSEEATKAAEANAKLIAKKYTPTKKL